MDIILLFLAKPLDKHGTTLVHITYPPLVISAMTGNPPYLSGTDIRQRTTGIGRKTKDHCHFPKSESRRSLGRKFDFFIPMGIQIEIDFHPTNTRVKVHCHFQAVSSPLTLLLLDLTVKQ